MQDNNIHILKGKEKRTEPFFSIPLISSLKRSYSRWEQFMQISLCQWHLSVALLDFHIRPKHVLWWEIQHPEMEWKDALVHKWILDLFLHHPTEGLHMLCETLCTPVCICYQEWFNEDENVYSSVTPLQINCGYWENILSVRRFIFILVCLSNIFSISHPNPVAAHIYAKLEITASPHTAAFVHSQSCQRLILLHPCDSISPSIRFWCGGPI